MVQASRPQADHITNFPFPSDPGPYSADQWAEYLRYFYTGDRQTTQGPLVDTDNCFAPTTNGTTQVSIDTGVGIVNGHVLVSSEQETWNIPAPTNQRMDIIAIVENNTNTEIIAATAAPTRPFLFPIGAATGEYTATPAVPPYSARLVIYQGTDGGAFVAPTLDTSNTKFAIELARYNITNVPVIDTLIDKQEWAVTPTASVQRIEQKVLAAAAISVTFAAIPQCFSHLRIEMQARSDRADAATTDVISLRFNADAGNNYDYIYGMQQGNNTRTTAAALATNQIPIANICNANAAASYADQYTVDIANYRRTTFYKTAVSHGATCADNVVNNMFVYSGNGWWKSTAAVTSVTLISLNGDNFLADSVFTLYGLT